MNSYIKLEQNFEQLLALREASGMLHWDASTMMPKGKVSAEARSEQLAVLNVVCHGILTSSETSDLLDEAETLNTLNNWQAANLREMRHMWSHAIAVTDDLVKALSKATMSCEIEWRSARAISDYEAIKPLLAEVLQLVKESAHAKSEVLKCSPYDALMDEYTPGLRQTTVDPIFQNIQTFLPNFIEAVLDKQAAAPQPLLPKGPFPKNQQRALGHLLMEAIGFDFDQGRLDVSPHPFSGGTPDDLRITTRYDQDDFTSGLMGILHETGHALYEKNLPRNWRRQPAGAARGMDVHESQSLLIEMQACRSKEFLSYAAPIMKKTFQRKGPEWEVDNLYKIYTTVKPGLIRVDADEVTYPAHVILRYNIERALITDDMTLNDLPAAWNNGMLDMLGQTPPNHCNGCMQDIHWFDGAWGYFPSYSLGAMTAAQIFDAALKYNQNILPAISQGNFAPLYTWLAKNIHSAGSLYETPELIKRATGKPLDPEIFKRHLHTRYLSETNED
jgi:carboxypeptidase Taq